MRTWVGSDCEPPALCLMSGALLRVVWFAWRRREHGGLTERAAAHQSAQSGQVRWSNPRFELAKREHGAREHPFHEEGPRGTSGSDGK